MHTCLCGGKGVFIGKNGENMYPCWIPSIQYSTCLHYLLNIKIDRYLSVDVALSDGFVLTSDCESEIFCDSMEQLDYIKV